MSDGKFFLPENEDLKPDPPPQPQGDSTEQPYSPSYMRPRPPQIQSSGSGKTILLLLIVLGAIGGTGWHFGWHEDLIAQYNSMFQKDSDQPDNVGRAEGREETGGADVLEDSDKLTAEAERYINDLNAAKRKIDKLVTKLKKEKEKLENSIISHEANKRKLQLDVSNTLKFIGTLKRDYSRGTRHDKLVIDQKLRLANDDLSKLQAAIIDSDANKDRARNYLRDNASELKEAIITQKSVYKQLQELNH